MNTAGEPQDMDGEIDIDKTSDFESDSKSESDSESDSKSESDSESDSKSESDSESESSTGSGSESENNSPKDGKQGEKRKRNCKQIKPSSICTNKKRKAEDSTLYSRETFGNKSEVPVTCGDKDGVLHVEKYNGMEKCIFSEGQWFKPNEFERFGGKERCKKWKTSIVSDNIPLQKLIEAGLLSSFKPSRVKNKQIDTPESSPVAVRLRKRKCQRTLFPSCSESNGRNDNDNGGVVEENDEDIIDMSVFEGPTLPVTCGSGSGVLHKYRFATGHCGRCIRTEDFWQTPEDFIRDNKPEGAWRKDILSSGVHLGKLIKKNVLEMHTLNCDCENCKDLDQYLNDDVCFICDSEGDLVCCDECPRAFHSHCHLPAVPEDSPGSQWSCTFCVMKKMKISGQKNQQDVLSSPVLYQRQES